MTTIRVGIIGSGVSGALTCVELMKNLKPDEKMVITVFEKEGERKLWAGVAYGTPAPWHLINIPSCAMSAREDEPDHLLQWLEKKRNANEIDSKWGTSKMHIPRGMWGEYLSDLVKHTIDECKANCEMKTVHEEVINFADGIIKTKEGNQYPSDFTVLCSGNFSPSNLQFEGSEAFYSTTKRYLQNPWKHLSDLSKVVASDKRVAIIGSRLTAVDVLLTLTKTNHKGDTHIISRKGLLPFANHSEDLAPPIDISDVIGFNVPDSTTDIIQDGKGRPDLLGDDTQKVDALFERLINKCIELQQKGEIWQSALDSLRPFTNRIWMCMSTEQRQLFLVKWRDEFEIRRHRVAPGILEDLEEILSKSVHHKGHLKSMKHVDGPESAVVIQVDDQEFEVDYVINCTGPQLDFRKVPPSELFQNLLLSGSITPEQTGIGLLVNTATGQLLDSSLSPNKNFFAVGPVRKGSEWETIAVKDIRPQAKQVALQIHKQIRS
eukprot:TRINITY_DN16747_c0_g1_i1.p1 TRINITY_DN16747_c0_g1~~TRINITY_DN16747_c0_g1_i1.p1  ORF type:complete len:520 (+),score=105.67 TRINITY_DN16747_c0_g1_i1:88-1560(+)